MTLACFVSFATPPASIPMDCVESMVSTQLPRKAKSEPCSRTPHKSAAADKIYVSGSALLYMYFRLLSTTSPITVTWVTCAPSKRRGG